MEVDEVEAGEETLREMEQYPTLPAERYEGPRQEQRHKQDAVDEQSHRPQLEARVVDLEPRLACRTSRLSPALSSNHRR